MKVIKKIGTIVINFLMAIVTIIVLFLMYRFIMVKFYHKNYVTTFGYSMFEIATGSMEPTLNVYDFILVKNDKNLNVNDIITYKEDNSFITHRIISIDGDNLITKGDANNSEDKIIKKDKVIGKVVKVIPKLGIIKNIIVTPKIMISFLIFIFLLNLSLSYKPNKEEKKDDWF